MTVRKALSKSRPMRVAFLVEDGEHAHLALDGIFADSYRRWGGRFSLIVPCEQGKVRADFWPWLEAYDPDVVYSYVALAETGILEIHERINPSVYKQHQHHGNEPRLDVFGFKPSYGAKALSSLSTIFQMARYRRSTPTGPVSIVDDWGNSSRFLTDNFGTYHASYSTGIFPPDALGAANLLTIVPRERAGVPKDLITIASELEAFAAVAEKRADSLAIASILYSSKLEFPRHRWGGSFNLVIGDSYQDRILFWNVRNLIPNWLDRDLCCLRVDPELLNDQAFFEVLVKFLNNNNHVNNGSGGQTSLTLRSCSLDQTALEQVQKRLRDARCWNIAQAEQIADLGAMLPTARDLEHASSGHRLGSGFDLGPDWTEIQWQLPTLRPPASTPAHLADAPPRQQFTTGVWATDYLIESDTFKPRFTNTNYWALPKSWRTAGAFSTKFSRSARDLWYPARTAKGGHLTQFESVERSVVALDIPSSYDVIQYALCGDGRWVGTPGQSGEIAPRSRSLLMEPSNEARYLDGLLGMASDLGHARRFLLHPFMRKVLSSFGGTPSLPVDKVAPTVARLRKLQPKVPFFDLADENERQALGTLIVKAAQGLRNPQLYIKYADLVSQWDAYLEAYWETHRKPKASDPRVDWDEAERDSLDDCLIEMRRRQMIFQGHQWTCTQCHNRTWIDLSSLGALLSCPVCHHESDAPIQIDWHFRPNDFMIEALRDHSALSLIWLIGALCDRARSGFSYAGPSWFWFNDPDGPPEAEVDLLAIVDGKSMVCEVKSSWAGLRPKDIDDLVTISQKLNTDIAVIAIMETGEGQNAKIRAAIETLKQSGIELRVMTLTTHPLRDDSYL
ncbi:hypothetical protein [Sphingobium sp. B11D3A]|uniref:hypothetical protein n=1 Tax=Sphingobium sp. B11D3A TaxID=2940574 RepID=UPI002224F18A|nr:hypothetical protein [Sphingobium sp. B11D3A]MCW2390945.1 hypothetical protein [Sphingobium sp. B11D3A]